MRNLHLLSGVGLLLGALSDNVAHAGNIIVGANTVGAQYMSEQQQDAFVEQLRQNGVKVVRTGIGGRFNHIGAVAWRAGIGAVVIVSPFEASKARWHQVDNAADAPWAARRT